MAITLADAQVNTQDDVDFRVIDEFRKSSWLLDNLTFDDVVNPSGGGATLTYGYTRVITERSAAFRAINSEYGKAEAKRQRYTVDLKPLGGAFDIDRVLANLGPAASNEVAFQIGQLVKSARAKFGDAFINGDVAVDANGFDGLDKALTGSTTELAAGTAVQSGMDWTTIATQADAFKAMEWLDQLVGALDERPTAILGNSKSLAKIKQITRYAGYLTQSEDAFGRPVAAYDSIPLIDLGAGPATTNPIIPVESRDLDAAGANAAIDGLTDVYAVRLGLDGVHGVSTTGQLVQTWLPDFTQAGAVKTGEAEMGPVAVAIKATKAAAVLRNAKVQ